MADQLVKSLKSVNIVLDEKKCGNMKQTIEFIQDKLRSAFELNRMDVRNRQANENETKKVMVKELSSSDEESESEDE